MTTFNQDQDAENSKKDEALNKSENVQENHALPPESKPVEPSQPKRKWDYTNWLLIGTVVGAIGFLSHEFDLIKIPSFGQKIAVVDTRLLVMAVSVEVNDQLKSGEINLDASQKKIGNYIEKMYSETKKYAENGYTVIPAQNVIFYSDKHDITPEIAKTIGVDYDDGLAELENLSSINNEGLGLFKDEFNRQKNNNPQSPKNIPENTNYEDLSNLDVLTNEDGTTSDLELFN